MTAHEKGPAAPGQAAYEEPPLVYDRWCHVDDPEITEDELAGMWNGESPAEREFWRSLVPRELAAAAAAQPASGGEYVAELRAALTEAVDHFEPLDRNDEHMIARWLELASRPKPAAPAAVPDTFPAAKAALARVLSWFTREGTYRDARATRAQLAHAYQDGELTVPEDLRRFL